MVMKYKLYYHPDIGVLIDTEHIEIKAFCLHLNSILDIIGEQHSLDHISQLQPLDTDIYIVIPRRNHPGIKPQTTILCKNKKLWKTLTKIVKQYFFKYKSLSIPPVDYIYRHIPEYVPPPKYNHIPRPLYLPTYHESLEIILAQKNIDNYLYIDSVTRTEFKS